MKRPGLLLSPLVGAHPLSQAFSLVRATLHCSQVRGRRSRPLLQTSLLEDKFKRKKEFRSGRCIGRAFKLLLLLPKVSFPASVCPVLPLVRICVAINLDFSRVLSLMLVACVVLTQHLPICQVGVSMDLFSLIR